MFRVVDYCRVSTEEERQLKALDTQQEENEDFIKKQANWTLVDRYIDEGKSATTTQGRDDFKRLLSDMQTDKFDIILIKILDRGWRNTLDWKLFEKLLITNKKQLFIKSRNSFYDFNNPTDYMATGFEAQFAEWSSLNQSIKMNQAHQTRMRKGTVVTSGSIWGYTQSNAKLEINEAEAEIVRYIFNAYIQGKGFRTIAKELEERGIKNHKGNPFALTTLKRIIRQEKYKGTLICGKRHKNFWTKEAEAMPEAEWFVHKNAVPAIISNEIWDEANKILAGRRKKFGFENKKRLVGCFRGTYVYSGKIKCGKCGRPYYHIKYTTSKHAVWECKGYREYGKTHEWGCNNTRMYDYEIDGIVKQIIFDFWQGKDASIERVIKILEGILLKNEYQTSIDKLLKDKEKLIRKKDKLIELYSEDLISKEDFKNRNDECSLQLEKMESDIKNIEAKNSSIIDKRDRLLMIQSRCQVSISSKDDLTDEYILCFLDSIIINPENIINITLNSNFEFVVQKENDSYTYENVSEPGSGRYTYRGCFR